MVKDAKEIIIDRLNELDVCITNADETEYTVRCPYCGDSSNPTHGHLGIKIDVDDVDMPMIWNCLKCGEGGRLSEDLLEDLGIHLSNEERDVLKAYDKKLAKLSGSRRSILRTARFKVPDKASNLKAAKQKFDYVQSRIGHPVDVVSHKMIVSFRDFLVFNEIESVPNIQTWQYQLIEDNYVGFLSSNNNCITFRRINDNPKVPKHYKCILDPFLPDNATFYSIPTRLNLLYTGPLHVHVAEGIYDILSVKFNLQRDESEKHLFYAACGYSYIKIIRHLARSGIITDLDLQVYADKDKTDRDHYKIVRDSGMSPFLQHMTIHRNGVRGEKDYGVTPDRIKDTFKKFW